MGFVNKKNWVVAGALVAVTAMATQASAETICATARRTTWNVPKGGVIINRSTSGVVKVILDSVNEWGTHTAMSHGFDGWVTHSTAKQPATQDSCSVPIKRVDLSTPVRAFHRLRCPRCT